MPCTREPGVIVTSLSLLANLRESLASAHPSTIDTWEQFASIPSADFFEGFAQFGHIIPSKRSFLQKIPKIQFNSKELGCYVPIERFRMEGLPPECDEFENFREFQSSGTTARVRAISRYSKDGLLLYRAGSVLTFFHLLARFYPQPIKVRGFSLVPNVKEWPQSSLSQMIEWFSEFWHLKNVDRLHLANELRDVKEPIWLFLTATQVIQIWNSKSRIILPEGSIVVETGGLKGIKEEFTREQIVGAATTIFGIRGDHVVSEYGMCELASQAYEWNDPGSSKRFFHTPPWMQVSAYTGLGNCGETGIGALLIADRFRIDVPYPIRTQDMAQVHSQNRFVYLGRVPTAPLKGCGLQIGDIQSERDVQIQSECKPVGKRSILPGVTQSSQALLDETSKYFRSSDFHEALESEFSHKVIAGWAQQDFEDCLPSVKEELNAAIENSGAHHLQGQKWLFVLPKNHSLASFYPVFLAAAAGIEISIRWPRGISRKTPLGHFLNLIARFASLTEVASDFRLSETQSLQGIFDGVFCYGASETIAQLKKLSAIPLVGCGSALALQLASADDVLQSPQEVLRDAFSLAQRGCMSVRAIVSRDIGEHNFSHISKNLTETWSRLSASAGVLSIEQQVALDIERERYSSLCCPVAPRSFGSDPVLPLVSGGILANGLSAQEYFSKCQFVLPVINVSNREELAIFLDCLSELRIVTGNLTSQIASDFLDLQANSRVIEFKSLGKSQQYKWDGMYLDAPMFSIT